MIAQQLIYDKFKLKLGLFIQNPNEKVFIKRSN